MMQGRNLIIWALPLFLFGCGIRGNEDGVKVKFNNVPVTTLAISGSVLSGTSTSFLRTEAIKRGKHASTNTCSSSTCTTTVIGVGNPGPSCSVSAGTFSIDAVPEGQQLEATFNCGGATQKCLVMAGDTGVTCNTVADGVIQAFLGAMGKSNLSDSTFQRVNIAQISHSIQQAAGNSSTAASTFANAVSACSTASDKKTCNLTAIKNSAFAGAFQIMQTMVNGWDAKAIFTFVTDVLNFQIKIDTFIYSDFGKRMDSWLNSNFNAQTAAVINAAIADQNSNGNNYSFKVMCSMQYSKYQGNGTITYTPRIITISDNGRSISVPSCTDKNDGTGPLSLNGFSSAQITLINNNVTNGYEGDNVNLSTDPSSHSCTEANPWNDSLYFCIHSPELVIATKASEANRNDPLGTNNNNFINTTKISLIETFPVVQTSLQSPPTPDPHTTGTGTGGSACLNITGDGAPQVVNDGTGPCNTWFGKLINSQKNNFGGVFGLYLALSNHTISANNKLSLNDIYKIFSDKHFLGEKLTIQGGQTGNGTLSSIKISSGEYMYPFLSDTGNGVCTLDPIFTAGTEQTVTVNQAENYLSAALVNYADSLQMFETIPTANSIHDFIFKSSYHVDYNPTGGRNFFAVGNANSANPDPIFCKMTDTSTDHVPIEVDMASQPNNVKISCAASSTLTGVSVDGLGNITVPTDFSYPYILIRFGFQGDSQGSIFALGDWRNGYWASVNGKVQYIYQENAGNPICKTAGEYDTVVQANMAMANGSTTYQQLITAYCMDMSPFATTNFENFYYAGKVEIPSSSANCIGCSLGGSLVGGYNSNLTNSFSTPPVCAWSSSFTTDSSNITTSTGTVVFDGSTGNITTVGDIVVDYCSASHGGTQYNLASLNNFGGASSPSGIFAQLIPSYSNSPKSGALPLQFSASLTDWIKISGDKITTGLMATLGAGYRAAPLSPPQNLKDIKLVNSQWQTKFDPYCDASSETDGKCHCIDGTTNAEKSGDNCTLEDSPKDGTLSQPPYFASSGSASNYINFYANFGGQDLSSFTCGDAGTGCNTPGAHLDYGNIPTTLFGSGGGINWNLAIRCKFLASAETKFRYPTNLALNWGNAQAGCPASAGAAVTSGPVTLIKPVAMNNAYSILKPNAAVKLANYVSRDIGQGITINPNDKLFTFDTAAALIALRNMLPVTGITVTSGSNTYKKVIGLYQPFKDPQINSSNNGKTLNEPISLLLCYLTNNGNACQ